MKKLNFLEENKDITELSNFKTKAIAEYFFELKEEKDVAKIKEIVDFVHQNNLKILFIGGGKNLLFAFDVFHGVVVHNKLLGWHYDENRKLLETYSWEDIWEIAEQLEKEYKQDIWHRFIGLPGTIGGAVFWNAWCFWLETENNFLKAVVLDKETWEIFKLKKEEMDFSYRSSLLKKNRNLFLIKAFFDLSEKKEKYASDVDNIAFRKDVQPEGNSGGSFFKNPSKEFSAGKFIESVWLKGYQHKYAFFSPKHANFLIMKKSWGDWRDLIELINMAKEKVKKDYNIELESEVQIIYS